MLGVVGASQDGSYVYFAATGQLVPGKGIAGQANRCTSRRLARLAAVRSVGDRCRLIDTTSRVSESGRYVTFMSERSLTGYDNLDVNSKTPDEEVYLYDAAANRLVCASCDPGGPGVVSSSLPNEPTSRSAPSGEHSRRNRVAPGSTSRACSI